MIIINCIASGTNKLSCLLHHWPWQLDCLRCIYGDCNATRSLLLQSNISLVFILIMKFQFRASPVNKTDIVLYPIANSLILCSRQEKAFRVWGNINDRISIFNLQYETSHLPCAGGGREGNKKIMNTKGGDFIVSKQRNDHFKQFV